MLLNEIKSLEEVEVTLRVNLMLPALADKVRYVLDALMQPQGEPVAWMYKFKTEDPILCEVKRDWADNHSQWKETPLYTTPPFVEAAIEATKEKVYQAIRDAETPATQLTIGQQNMIKAAIKGMK